MEKLDRFLNLSGRYDVTNLDRFLIAQICDYCINSAKTAKNDKEVFSLLEKEHGILVKTIENCIYDHAPIYQEELNKLFKLYSEFFYSETQDDSYIKLYSSNIEKQHLTEGK